MSLGALTVHVSPAEAATFTVNTADVVNDGTCNGSHCSLREAFNAANRFSDTDTITFNIPGPPPHTIPLAGWLRRLFFPVIIDATTQPGYAGRPIVELDGTLGGAPNAGLTFVGGSSTVRGLVINRVPGNGIHLAGTGNYVIEGNYIGTDVTGTIDLGNGADGIWVTPDLENGGNTIVRNVISGNGLNGIMLTNDRNVIQGNYIGTDASGTSALGNDHWGIRMVGQTTKDNVIGGTAPDEGNVISANGRITLRDGIVIHGAVPTALTGNVIQGNYIGTNASGTAALGNGGNGISTCGNDTTIGGTALGARNIISGNGWNGIYIGCRSTGSVVQGNLIGTAEDGTTALGNGFAAPLNRDSGIETYAGDNTIGGTAPGAGNTIAYNLGPGVSITGGGGSFGPPFSRNGILSNSIFSNGGLGIDLYTRGVLPNDPGDTDRGPNELQNFPVLTSASGNTIEGTLNSIANTTFRLEFFANREADPSGHAEGERFLGAASVTTDGSGNASFSFVSPTSFSGRYVSATATDPSNNTSEFSGVLLTAGPAPPAALTLSPPSATNDVGEEHCVTAAVRDGSGNPTSNITVRFSVSGANSATGSAPTGSNGEAEFCYPGTNPGQDTIGAYADTKDNGVQDPGEPFNTASKLWVQPATTVGRVTTIRPICNDFAAGTAAELPEVLYAVRPDGKIGGLEPSAIRYWTRVIAPAASFTIEVRQTTTHPSFGILFDLAHTGQVRLHDSTCHDLTPASIAIEGDQATVSVTGATPGQTYFLSVRYGTQPFLSKPAPSPPTVHYDFQTRVDGVVVDADPNGIDLRKT